MLMISWVHYNNKLDRELPTTETNSKLGWDCLSAAIWRCMATRSEQLHEHPTNTNPDNTIPRTLHYTQAIQRIQQNLNVDIKCISTEIMTNILINLRQGSLFLPGKVHVGRVGSLVHHLADDHRTCRENLSGKTCLRFDRAEEADDFLRIDGFYVKE